MLPSCTNEASPGANLAFLKSSGKIPRFTCMVPQAKVFLETRSFKSFVSCSDYQNTDYDSCRDMAPSDP